MMSFFLMFLVNRPRLCLCMLKKAVVAYWFDISWPLKFSSKESDFIAPLAPVRFCKSMKEILYQICHEFYSEGKTLRGNLHKPAKQFNGVGEFPTLDWTRVGITTQALSFREEAHAQQ